MKSILIGSTGFVGSNLRSQIEISEYASSKNIYQYKDVKFDLGYIAAGDARKWIANQSYTKDKEHIDILYKDISNIKIDTIIHFSTVDVYQNKFGYENPSINDISQEPYGNNRFYLEEKLRDICPNYYLIRLPGLFGPGLKKNIIYDINVGKDISNFNLNSSFQWFDLLDLKNIIDFVLNNNIRELNVCSEPLTVYELLDLKKIPKGACLTNNTNLVSYNIKSRYSKKFSGHDSYLYTKLEIIRKLLYFYERNKVKK